MADTDKSQSSQSTSPDKNSSPVEGINRTLSYYGEKLRSSLDFAESKGEDKKTPKKPARGMFGWGGLTN